MEKSKAGNAALLRIFSTTATYVEQGVPTNISDLKLMEKLLEIHHIFCSVSFQFDSLLMFKALPIPRQQCFAAKGERKGYKIYAAVHVIRFHIMHRNLPCPLLATSHDIAHDFLAAQTAEYDMGLPFFSEICSP